MERQCGQASADMVRFMCVAPSARCRTTIYGDHVTGVSVMATSKKDASKAGKLLSSHKASRVVKSVAGSDLAQAKRKPKKRKPKKK